MKLEFLRAKAALIIARAKDEDGRKSLSALFSGLGADPSVFSAGALRSADRLLRECFEIFAPEIRAQLEEGLMRRFGIVRLGKPTKSAGETVDIVLRRGGILTDEVARIVQEFMVDTTNIEVIGLAAYKKLGKILDTYECDASRRARD